MATGKTLSEAIQMLIDNVELTAETTGLLVKQKMQEDFEDMAKGTVDKYYEYKKGQYTKYGRQHNLYKVYNVTTNMKHTKKAIKVEVNIHMDSDALDGLYHSNASEKWADVEADYVFKNFMLGYHPWTNGWPISGVADLVYKEIKASPRVETTINKYKKSYGDKYFSKYVDTILMQLIKVYL